MAFSVQMTNKNEILMIINGCNDKNCTGENGCGQFDIITVPYDSRNVSPPMRLLLHNIFGRQYRLKNILTKYEEFYENEENKGKNGCETMKNIIIDDCNTDNDWKICSKCYEEYKNDERKFEKVYYTIPDLLYCDFHI